MGRCVWRIVCRGNADTFDFIGVADIVVCIVKKIPSTYKPKNWVGVPLFLRFFENIF